MTLSLILYGVYQVVRALVGVVGTSVISKRKNRKNGWLKIVVSALLPPVGILWSLVQKKHPPQGHTPEEQELFNSRFSIEQKKSELERVQKRQDKLGVFHERSLVYKATHPLQWFPGMQMRINDRFIARKQGDIRAEYEMLGRYERKAQMSGRDRFVAVRMDRTRSGVRFGIPYDVSKDVANEMKFLLSQRFGVDINDPRVFYQSEHRSADMSGYRPGRTVVVFDTKEHVISPLGAELPPEQLERVKKLNTDQRFRLVQDGLMERNGKYIQDNLLTISPIGNEAVALSFNGVCLAYAVADADGKIRMVGHNVKTDDKKGTQMASSLYERFRGIDTIAGWIDVAEKLVMSDSNIESCRQGQQAKVSARRKLKEHRALRREMLHGPKLSLNTISKGIKL